MAGWAKRTIIAPSILSADLLALAKQLKEIEGKPIGCRGSAVFGAGNPAENLRELKKAFGVK